MSRNYGVLTSHQQSDSWRDWPKAIVPHSVRRQRARRGWIIFGMLCVLSCVAGALIVLSH